MPSSRRSSGPRDGPYVSWPPALAGRFFTTDAACEAQRYKQIRAKANSVLCLQLLVSLKLFQNLKFFKKITYDCETRGADIQATRLEILEPGDGKPCQGTLFLGLLWYSSGKESTFQGRGYRFHPWWGKESPCPTILSPHTSLTRGACALE